MEQVEVRIVDWVAAAIDMYRKNFVLLVATHFVGVMLGVVSLFVLLGPMMAGLMMIALSLADGKEPRPQVGDLFDGFSCFFQPFLFFVVWVVILGVLQSILVTLPGVGQPVAVMANIVAGALMMFGMPLIVDQELDFWRASLKSFETVRNAFWPFVALSALASLIASSGAILFGFGMFLTLPIYTCITAIAYRAVFTPEANTRTESGRPPAIDV